MFDWDDLRHFVALARAGTLAGAARELGVDHVTVGRRVAALEAALGVELLRRQARRTTLTEAGKEIARLGTGLHDEAHGILRAAAALRSSEARVTLSAPPALATYVLAPLVGKLLDLHPSLRLVLIGEVRAASLTRQEADVALRLWRPSEPGYVARRVARMRFAAFASPGYADRPPGTWRFVAHHRAEAPLPQDEVLRTLAGDRSVVLETNDLASQRAAAASGLGVAMLPSFLAPGMPELAEVRMEGAKLDRDLWLVAHQDLRRSPPVRLVLDFLAATLKGVKGLEA